MASDIPSDSLTRRTEQTLAASQQYAHATEALEKYRAALHAPVAGERLFAQAAALLNVYPVTSSFNQVTGLDQKVNWSAFQAPPGYYDQRTSSSIILQSLPSEAEAQKIAGFIETTDDIQRAQGQNMIGMLTEVQSYNDRVADIIGKSNALIPA